GGRPGGGGGGAPPRSPWGGTSPRPAPGGGRPPRLWGPNRRNLLSLHDADHGGAPGQGRGAAWVREVLAERQVPADGAIWLMAQPR
ncbi:MAG TPA: hypothetical protein PKC84_11860, partial [Paracoccaceae bacterium]|nr:hypothetical protein [Paracoccaceae bacterium]